MTHIFLLLRECVSICTLDTPNAVCLTVLVHVLLLYCMFMCIFMYTMYGIYVVVYVVIVLPVLPPDASLTPHTLLHAVSTVREFWNIGGLLSCLDVPRSVRDRIRHSQSYSSEDEKRMAGLQYCLQTVPGVSWGRIAGVLWQMEEHTALETVRQYLPPKHGTIQEMTACV